MADPRICSHCGKQFQTGARQAQHVRDKHKRPVRARPDDEEESFAMQVVNARLERAMGGDVPDYLLDILDLEDGA